MQLYICFFNMPSWLVAGKIRILLALNLLLSYYSTGIGTIYSTGLFVRFHISVGSYQ